MKKRICSLLMIASSLTAHASSTLRCDSGLISLKDSTSDRQQQMWRTDQPRVYRLPGSSRRVWLSQ